MRKFIRVTDKNKTIILIPIDNIVSVEDHGGKSTIHIKEDACVYTLDVDESVDEIYKELNS